MATALADISGPMPAQLTQEQRKSAWPLWLAGPAQEQELTEDQWKSLDSINRHVNETTPRINETDPSIRMGNCVMNAAAKRDALIAAGFPAQVLGGRIVAVDPSRNMGSDRHMLLEVRGKVNGQSRVAYLDMNSPWTMDEDQMNAAYGDRR